MTKKEICAHTKRERVSCIIYFYLAVDFNRKRTLSMFDHKWLGYSCVCSNFHAAHRKIDKQKITTDEWERNDREWEKRSKTFWFVRRLFASLCHHHHHRWLATRSVKIFISLFTFACAWTMNQMFDWHEACAAESTFSSSRWPFLCLFSNQQPLYSFWQISNRTDDIW